MAALFVATGVNAQGVFKCVDGGKVVFSDKPCSDGQKSSEVRIYKQPTAPAPRMSTEAVEYEKVRQQRRQESDESHRRIDNAAARVQQIRADNHDPRKCAEARERVARMERRDPLTAKINPDYFEFQQMASLHCGN